MVTDHPALETRQGLDRTVHVAVTDQVARQTLGAEQNVVVIADDDRRGSIQLGHAPGADLVGAPDVIALLLRRRVGRDEHHRVMRHPETANDLAHDLPLQSSRKGCALFIGCTQTLLVQSHVASGGQLLPEAHGQHRVDAQALQRANVELNNHLPFFLAQIKASEELAGIRAEALLGSALHG
ncbi:hypothetical protein D3C81_1595530 [compost metagenome]